MAEMAPLSEAVPGWEGELIREAVDRTIKGVAREQARLLGSRFLVVARIYELDIDGIFETVRIESGHVDFDDAVARAQLVGSQRLVEEGIKHDNSSRKWSHDTARNRWPNVTPVWQGRPVPVFCDRLSDGSGFNAVEVSVAVIPTDPENPINAGVVNTIDLKSELVRWFDEVQKPT